MYLGAQDDRLCTIAEIAKAYGISGKSPDEGREPAQLGRFRREWCVAAAAAFASAKWPGATSLGRDPAPWRSDFHLVECFGTENTRRTLQRLPLEARSAARVESLSCGA